LKASDSDLRILEYQLTTLPRRLGWLAIPLGLGIAVASLQTDAEAFGLVGSRTTMTALFLYPFTIFAFSTMVALAIQTVRQLRLVIDLHRRATEINLFQLAPAHAFASLTARTGIGLVIFIIFSALLESSNITQGNLIGLVAAGILAIFVFTMPLIGMRNRLKDEKARVVERDLIDGISTWPWEPGTLRGFASTLLLPIFVWLVTRLLERFI
jgi:hypothetical protein